MNLPLEAPRRYGRRMKITAATVGIPVRDLDASVEWYRAALELGDVELVPMDGLVEFDLGPVWLQLNRDPGNAGREGISINLSVDDAATERDRLAGLGLDVTEVTRYEGVVDFFALTDPDGNQIGFVTELS